MNDGEIVQQQVGEEPVVELEDIEIRALLDTVFRYYGFDFRDYAPRSLRRRLWSIAEAENLPTISALQARVLHDRASAERFLLGMSVGETSMFRDPAFFRTFREKVVPLLRTYPFVRIWSAGCSTGQEAYSVAIVLEEEGLYDRSRIYATDMNEASVRKAQAGIVSLSAMKEYTSNHFNAGGQRSFSDYYTAAYDHAILSPALRRNIVFAQHNLVNDASFNDFHVIMCRNVLIYFNRPLQHRVLQLFHDSLIPLGVLCLGSQESLRFTPHERDYQELATRQQLYQRIRKR